MFFVAETTRKGIFLRRHTKQCLKKQSGIAGVSTCIKTDIVLSVKN